jgi:diguanylate cyclase (GGDEF)-like protein/PAS domain S-box-containing protein
MNDIFYRQLFEELPIGQPEKKLKENEEKEKRASELITAEEALGSNQRQLRDIIEFLPDATLAIDKEKRVIIWNKAIEKMTCIPAMDMIGKGDYTYTIPFYGKAQPQLMDLVFLDDEEIATQYPNLTREGDTLMGEVFCSALNNNKGAWVFAKASPLHDQAGNIIGAVESIRDITERKQAEEEILESRNFLAILLESIPTPVFYKDINGRYLGFNRAYEDFFGKTKDELIGKSVFDISPVKLAKIYHAKDAELFERPGTQTYETQVKDARGVLHDIVFYKATMVNSRGKVTGLIGTMLDITERKRLETALSNEKKLLETTLTSVGDGVISTDNKGNIVFLNRVAEFLTGWEQEAAMGKSIEEVFNIINEFTREKSENIVNKVLESRRILELADHTILISKDGIERSIEDSAAPIVQENGEIIGVVLVFRDFSEKKLKQEKIEFLSYHDQLTGLYNRRFYEEELERLDTERNLPMTIVMGDVNGLKIINDSFGHVLGDELLKKVAEVITKGCRADDIIARLGGDEFVIILPKTNASESERIIKRLNDLLLKEKVESIDISVSFGWETKNNGEEKVEEIFSNAEDNMYKRKLVGRPHMRENTITAIISTRHEKSKREEQHSARVSELCKNMGEALGLPENKIKELKSVGLLHDIGKIVIDESVLNKSGELTDNEWKEIKRHPEVGYRILSTVYEMAEMAKYVLHHHERWDGKGYPKGLKSEEILLQARIIAIADAYDAMTSDRTYKKVLSEEEAINEIRRCSGTQFDPEIARLFVEKVMRKEWELIEK